MAKIAVGFGCALIGWLAAVWLTGSPAPSSWFVLWPPPATGLESWPNPDPRTSRPGATYRLHSDGVWHRDASFLSCPKTLRDFGLDIALYKEGLGIYCTYSSPSAKFEFTMSTEPPFDSFGPYEPITLNGGTLSGRHERWLASGYQDRVVVFGDSMMLILSCSQPRYLETLDVDHCDALQAEFLSRIGPQSLGGPWTGQPK